MSTTAGNGILTLALLWTLLPGCGAKAPTQTAGGQDFPNSMAAVGALAVHLIERSGEWERLDRLTDAITRPTSAPSLEAPQTPEPGGLARRQSASAAHDTSYWDYSDTSRGTAVEYRFHEDSSIIASDTVTVRYDVRVKDTVPGNELVIDLRTGIYFKPLGTYALYHYTDDDSDGRFDRRTFFLVFPPDQGVTTRIGTYDDPGPDGEFATWEDNRTVAVEHAVFRGVDTLTYQRWADADGDRVVWPDSTRPSSAFDLTHVAKGDSAGPAVDRSFLRARVLVPTADIAATVATKLYHHTVMRNGGAEELWLGGYREDSTLLQGDSAWLRVRHTYPSPDTIAVLTVDFRLLLGTHPVARFSENSMLSLTVHCDLRFGAIGHAELTFRPDVPVFAGGTVPAAGIDMRADMGAGGTAHLTGRFDGRLTADFVDPSGNRFRGEWDEEGNLVNLFHR